MCSVPPDDGLQICPKHVEIDWRIKLRINSAFDVHVTVHRVKFLKIKPTRCTNFSNLFWDWKSTCFGQLLCPSSGVFLLYIQQTCMTYTIGVCTLKNSWWWTEELSETCRLSFKEWIWEISASSWFYCKINSASSWFSLHGCIEMHGQHNIKFSTVKCWCGST